MADVTMQVFDVKTQTAYLVALHDNGDGTYSPTSYVSGLTLNAADIEIGAVELKDGATDTRAKVKSDGTDNAVVVMQNAPPTGAATAAKQDTGNTSLSSVDSKMSTLLLQTDGLEGFTDGVETLLTAISNALASVALASQGYSASVSLTRTNDTNAYTANDVVGAATGSTAALTFASMGPSAGRIMITSVSIEIDASAVISGETSYTLHLYDVTPPSALGDNAAFDLPSGDRSNYLGSIALGTPADLGSTLYVEANQINKQLKLAGTSLFGYLVTAGAHTPTASRVYVVKLHAVSL
jgi:hypothetical protein